MVYFYEILSDDAIVICEPETANLALIALQSYAGFPQPWVTLVLRGVVLNLAAFFAFSDHPCDERISRQRVFGGLDGLPLNLPKHPYECLRINERDVFNLSLGEPFLYLSHNAQILLVILPRAFQCTGGFITEHLQAASAGVGPQVNKAGAVLQKEQVRNHIVIVFPALLEKLTRSLESHALIVRSRRVNGPKDAEGSRSVPLDLFNSLNDMLLLNQILTRPKALFNGLDELVLIVQVDRG